MPDFWYYITYYIIISVYFTLWENYILHLKLHNNLYFLISLCYCFLTLHKLANSMVIPHSYGFLFILGNNIFPIIIYFYYLITQLNHKLTMLWCTQLTAINRIITISVLQQQGNVVIGDYFFLWRGTGRCLALWTKGVLPVAWLGHWSVWIFKCPVSINNGDSALIVIINNNK